MKNYVIVQPINGVYRVVADFATKGEADKYADANGIDRYYSTRKKYIDAVAKWTGAEITKIKTTETNPLQVAMNF